MSLLLLLKLKIRRGKNLLSPRTSEVPTISLKKDVGIDV